MGFIGFKMSNIQAVSKALASFLEQGEFNRNAQWDFLHTQSKSQGASEETVFITGEELGQPDNHNKYFKNSNSWLDEHSMRLAGHFLKKGFEHIPVIEKQPSAGKHKSTYSMGIRVISDQVKKDIANLPEYPLHEGGTRYHINQQSKKRNTLLPTKVTLTGWRKWLFVFLALCPFIVLFIAVVSGALDIDQDLNRVLALGVSVGLMFVMSYPYLSILFSGAYLRKFAPSNSVMLLLTAKKDKRLLDHREIVFRTYEAKCGICGGTIELNEEGPVLRRKRIFGECRENPMGHRYSFDYVTGVGEKL